MLCGPLQASAFLYKYTKLRGRCQETLYNLGRAFHQLGTGQGPSRTTVTCMVKSTNVIYQFLGSPPYHRVGNVCSLDSLSGCQIVKPLS